jgi:hypothetical protein
LNTDVRRPTQALFCQPMFVTKWSAIPPLPISLQTRQREQLLASSHEGNVVMQIDKLKGLLL